MKPIKGNTILIKSYKEFVDQWQLTGNKIMRNKTLLVEYSEQKNKKLFMETLIDQVNKLTDFILIHNDISNLFNLSPEDLQGIEYEYRHMTSFLRSLIEDDKEQLDTLKVVTDQCERIFQKRKKD